MAPLIAPGGSASTAAAESDLAPGPTQASWERSLPCRPGVDCAQPRSVVASDDNRSVAETTAAPLRRTIPWLLVRTPWDDGKPTAVKSAGSTKIDASGPLLRGGGDDFGPRGFRSGRLRDGRRGRRL